MEILPFNVQGAAYTTNQDILVEKNLNAFTVVNEGDGILFINGIELKPFPPGHPELTGEAVTIGGNLGEVYQGRIELRFTAGQVTPKAVVIKKFYI